MKNFIPVNRPVIKEQHIKKVVKSLKKAWISGDGPYVKEFENKFKKKIGMKYAVSVSNGSSALVIAIASLKLKPGSKIIVPATTIISCLNAIIKNNLKPIFVDVSLDDYNIDIIDLKKKLPVMLKHYY